MKILITGGTGYIGSHTVVELLQKGKEVIVLDNLSNSFITILERIKEITGIRPEFEKIDLTDKKKLHDFFLRHSDIESVIHFAAYKAVGESSEKPLKYYHNNLISLMNLIEEMDLANISKLVFSSSCTVYGQPEKLPVTEESPVQPAYSPYGNTKQISEEIIRDCSLVSNLKAISLRYFNPIGAHESALIGEIPSTKPNNLLPYITQTAIGKLDDFKVWGNDYNTPDGSCIRDYIHVVDLAKAHVIALERMERSERENYELFNIGTGNGNSVFEVIETFEKISGKKLNYTIASKRPGDVEKVYADTTKANKVLGWKAEKNLEDMISSSWKWEQQLATTIKNGITKKI